MNRQKHKRVIISGGGTGGHIFPAISIANALRKIDPDTEILFVGAEGRMEMEKVPAAGYQIKGLPVAGLYRQLTLKNITVIIKLFKSLRIARKVISDFNPDVVVGVGGYASGPVLRQAGKMGIPTLIQEQNSYAGVTNKLLAKKASVICVAYDGMEKYFPAGKIIKTGNPVRQNFDTLNDLKEEAISFFGLKPGYPIVLVLGGSLGAGSINRSLADNIGKLRDSDCQWLWQTGKHYFENVKALVSVSFSRNISVHGFINRMDYAYAAADIIVTRAGAGTISELCLVGKPVILVPSPNVAEDHQTKNARALSDREAAILITDNQAVKALVSEAVRLVSDVNKRAILSENISRMADRDADIRIAEEVLKLAGR
ncbi:MAG: undecaprenyldiphospho-muramoylpentapeptide beta-N-acetylglucosaminyltransferase [Bacteroidetes bacterium GWE2_41_25]|nr:MAG: undecaprenyldiphospho-muramoylpentapeptide beta-N-acetylglucosaminyltransferase [Bacteroidetes bacterium GWA2_40_15]OFX97410.1 MAG: undecaprenyldiphospho-muramoylpentapeptide beta-N-acetylglucosaminyltransferase [Bacteroidetes bacterium GWC2_40_22]OFX97844.1 MAG: undecaprenyldiphospho-muramoylpentapeptide beta-N-acetylglucosaminyltransferase [Bacteroidetes bacterium GWE2_41_25]OFY59485.1 MAG: undecaprenyldiphospho-muramoylpentapeptide beta-N-acetylglucosaminyltransferase [Bacteroidetes b